MGKTDDCAAHESASCDEPLQAAAFGGADN